MELKCVKKMKIVNCKRNFRDFCGMPTSDIWFRFLDETRNINHFKEALEFTLTGRTEGILTLTDRVINVTFLLQSLEDLKHKVN